MGEELRLLSSTALIERLRVGDSQTWERLVARYAPLVYHRCRHAGMTPADARDAAVETFRTLCERARDEKAVPEPPGDKTLLTMLQSMTDECVNASQVSEAGDYVSGNASPDQATIVRTGPLEQPAVMTGVEDTLGLGILARGTLKNLEGEFDNLTLEAFRATVFDHEPVETVAARFGKPPGWVHRSRHAVLKRFRHELAD
jgi:RNA polymerase sigma-70 factor (ECF subfamily)